MKKLLLILFCLAILQVTLFFSCSNPESKGPATISGKVISQEDNSAMNDVFVQLENSDMNDSTNVDGNYSITGIAPGTFDITASKSGYQNVTKTDITVRAGENLTINFTLPVVP